MLNILIGVGVSMTIKTSKVPSHKLPFPLTQTIFLSAVVALISLSLHTFVLYIFNFKLHSLNRFVGIGIYTIYVGIALTFLFT